MNIVLDFGGVLMKHDKEGCWHALRQIMSDDAITNVLGFGNDRPDTLRHRFETGQCTTRDFLSNVLAHGRNGTTEQQVIDAWNTMHAGIPDSIWTQLERLRDRGYHLYLMSNTDDIHWQHTLSLYGDKMALLFDDIFLSFKEGLAKPDEAFFQLVNRRLNTAPVVFVDDMEINRLSAEKFVAWQTFRSIDELPFG
jgi:putative hydrolase of the HAD superfamily